MNLGTFARNVFVSILFLPLFAAVQREEIKVPDEAKPFIESGSVVLDYKTGDLNGDGRRDAYLSLQSLAMKPIGSTKTAMRIVRR